MLATAPPKPAPANENTEPLSRDNDLTNEKIASVSRVNEKTASVSRVNEKTASVSRDEVPANHKRDLAAEGTLNELLARIASSEPNVISVQKDKPDPTPSEVVEYLRVLFENKPVQFLYRYNRHLQVEDSILFKGSQNETVKFYLTRLAQTKRSSYKATRNRRYCRLQQLLEEGTYFSEEEMKEREPQLYFTMVGRYETDADQEERRRDKMSRDPKFSTFLLAQSDKEEYMRKCEQVEESESDDEETTETKEELLTRFRAHMTNKFLTGSDNHVSYLDIDYNQAYDDLALRSRDEQDSYFDDDEDEMTSRDIDEMTSRDIDEMTSRDIDAMTSRDIDEMTSRDIEEMTSRDIEEREFRPPVRK